MKFSFLLMPILGIVLLVGVGCNRNGKTASGSLSSNKQAQEPAAGNTPGEAVAKKAGNEDKTASQVVQVVFVEKKNCCHCTKTRQKKSWTALQDAVKASKTPVDVIKVFLDTQRDLAKTYIDMKPLIAVPGLYFLDKNGTLINLLQGEVTQAQVAKILALKP